MRGNNEYYLGFLLGRYIGPLPPPITCSDFYLLKLCGMWEGALPSPITLSDILLKEYVESGGGGGGGGTLIEKIINSNGVYNAADDGADGYSKVTVDVEGEDKGYMKAELEFSARRIFPAELALLVTSVKNDIATYDTDADAVIVCVLRQIQDAGAAVVNTLKDIHLED